MIKLDPIIAVKDVQASSNWYQAVFNCKSLHGGKHFDVLVAEDGEVLICLHPWGEHQHPTMTDANIAVGNGLILYFKTDKMNAIRSNAESVRAVIVEDIHVNANSTKLEFSMRDPDGYYLTITEYHKYEG